MSFSGAEFTASLIGKHLVLLALILWLVPVLARPLAQHNAAQFRMWRPGLTTGFILARLLIAVGAPVVAEGLYEAVPTNWSRILALAVAGALYGAWFGDRQDFPPVRSVLWGVIGGLLAAFVYLNFPATELSRALIVALFAVAPGLAYQPIATLTRRRLGLSGQIHPRRDLLH